MEVLVSENNIDFTSVGKLDSIAIRKSGRQATIKFSKKEVRFVKVIATTAGKIQTTSSVWLKRKENGSR